MLILFPQTSILLIRELCCVSLKTDHRRKKPYKTQRVALDWLFKRTNLDPKIQIKYMDTKNQLADVRENSHVTNGTIFCVCLTLAISVPSIVLKRCRKEHKKMQMKKQLQQNQSRWWIWYHDTAWGSERASLDCIRKPGENQRWKSQKVPLSSLNEQQPRKGRPVLGASSSNYSEWRQVVFSRVEICWNVEHKYDETRIWQVCHRWYGLWHRHRIEPFSKITIILEQSEWSIAKDVGPILQKMQCKTSTNVLWFGQCYVFDIGSICIHGKELLGQFTNPSKIQGKISLQSRSSKYLKKLIIEKSGDIFGVSQHQLGKFSMETIISGKMMKKSSVSRMQRLMYFHILCYVLDKWIRTHHQNTAWEEQLSWFKDSPQHRNFGHHWRRTDGIRVEYVPETSHIAALQQSPRVHVKNERSIRIPRTNYLHVDVQWHHMENNRQWTRIYC